MLVLYPTGLAQVLPCLGNSAGRAPLPWKPSRTALPLPKGGFLAWEGTGVRGGDVNSAACVPHSRAGGWSFCSLPYIQICRPDWGALCWWGGGCPALAQQNLCRGIRFWAFRRRLASLCTPSPGAALPWDGRSAARRQLWRCFPHRNTAAVFLQISAVANGSLSNGFEINNCGFFGSICSVILPDLRQSCAAPQPDGSDRSAADRAGASVSLCFALHLWA